MRRGQKKRKRKLSKIAFFFWDVIYTFDGTSQKIIIFSTFLKFLLLALIFSQTALFKLGQFAFNSQKYIRYTRLVSRNLQTIKYTIIKEVQKKEF